MCVHMRTKIENGTNSNHRVLRVAFIDQGKFGAMKTLSGRRALRCDEHQFRAKMTVST